MFFFSNVLLIWISNFPVHCPMSTVGRLLLGMDIFPLLITAYNTGGNRALPDGLFNCARSRACASQCCKTFDLSLLSSLFHTLFSAYQEFNSRHIMIQSSAHLFILKFHCWQASFSPKKAEILSVRTRSLPFYL